jgi:hypothetical protein
MGGRGEGSTGHKNGGGGGGQQGAAVRHQDMFPVMRAGRRNPALDGMMNRFILRKSITKFVLLYSSFAVIIDHITHMNRFISWPSPSPRAQTTGQDMTKIWANVVPNGRPAVPGPAPDPMARRSRWSRPRPRPINAQVARRR